MGIGKLWRYDFKILANKMLIKVKVKPNSGKQEVIKKEDDYLVYLKSSPENNRANLELVRILSRHFNREVRIKRGFKSREKVVEIK
ncbi:MAG: DUF167 domain-containing protein [archaeon]